MSFFASLFERKVVDASNLTTSRLMPWGTSKTGLTVNELTALRVAAVWACCRVICEDIGKVPLQLLKGVDGGENELATSHVLFDVLRWPNEWQTSMEWRMTQLLHALLCGGGYSFINRNDAGDVLELIPLRPGRVVPKQDDKWNVTYEVSDKNGKIATLQRDQVHALRGLSWDGLNAIQVISAGREAIGLAMATEQSQARLHGQGARPGGALTTTANLSDEQVDRIKQEFADNYTGVDNSFKTILLDAGVKFEPWQMKGVDSQHLETRRFQVEEVARLFRVFPAMIGYSDKATTYASAEAFFAAHVGHTLMPWAVNWEQAIARDLLTPKERKKYHAKFHMDSLLRGDAKTRATFYESAITKACWMTRNEARRRENLNPLPGLDELLVPMNMQTGADAGKDPEPTLNDE